MKLRVGILENSQKLFSGTIRFFLGAKSGKLWASYSGKTFKQIDVPIFGTSDINDISYETDLSIPISTATITDTFDTINTGTTWNTSVFFDNFERLGSSDYGNGLWLLGGTYGLMYRSTDTISWTTVSRSESGFFNINNDLKILYKNNLWVAAGNGVEIRTSTNTITWTTAISNLLSTDYISSLGYGNGVWLIGAGFSGQIRTSTDTVTWITQQSNISGSPAGISTLAYGNGLWTLFDYYGEFRTSTDAITWTTRNSFPAYLFSSVNYGNGLWVGGGDSGQLFTSTDAITWVTQTSNFGNTTYINSIAYSNGLWIAVGQFGQLRTSTNAITWVTKTSNFGTSNILSITYGNGLWIANGWYGKIRTSPQLYFQYNNSFFAAGNSGKVAKSTDGFSWTTINTGLNTNISKISYGGTSSIPFAESWNEAPISNFGGNDYNPLSDIVYDGTQYYAFVSIDIYKSTNGIFWNNTNQIGSLGGGTLKKVEYNQQIYVLAHTGGIRTSTNTISWTSRISNFATTITSLVYGNGLWVAGGYYGQLRTSTDAVTWVTQTSNFGNTRIFSIAYGNGLWVAGGYIGQLRTSTDTITWITQTSNFGNTAIQSIAYGNGLWVAGGDTGQLRTSTNAVTWVTRNSNFGNTRIQSIAYGNGKWLISHATPVLVMGLTPFCIKSTDGITWSTNTLNFFDMSIGKIFNQGNLWIIGNGSVQSFGNPFSRIKFKYYIENSLDINNKQNIVGDK